MWKLCVLRLRRTWLEFKYFLPHTQIFLPHLDGADPGVGGGGRYEPGRGGAAAGHALGVGVWLRGGRGRAARVARAPAGGQHRLARRPDHSHLEARC